MQESDWTPTTGEDRLLKQYVEACGGVAYAEVPVGIDEPHGTRRRLDAVRFPADPGGAKGIWRWSVPASGEREFWDSAAAQGEVEVVEVKAQLGPRVIGQAYTGKLLLENQLKASTAKPKVTAVAVCGGMQEGRTADGLLQVCQSLGVTVWLAGFLLPDEVLHEADRRNRTLALSELTLVGCGRTKTPTRGLVGRLIVAKRLLEMVHTDLRVNPVISCEETGNVSLEEVCKELNIRIETHDPLKS